MEIAVSANKMQLARALLGDDFFKPVANGGAVEILHQDFAAFDRLRLEFLFATDCNRPERNAERFAAAPHRLHQFDEPVAKDAAADFLLERFVKIELFHQTSSPNPPQSSSPSNTLRQGPVSESPETERPSHLPSTISSNPFMVFTATGNSSP